MLLACLSPGRAVDAGLKVPGLDKAVHAALFFLESFFLLRALRGGRPAGRIRYLSATALAGGLAVLTEAAQIWVPNRIGSVRDLLADFLGILLCVAWFSFRQKASNDERPHP